MDNETYVFFIIYFVLFAQSVSITNHKYSHKEDK